MRPRRQQRPHPPREHARIRASEHSRVHIGIRFYLAAVDEECHYVAPGVVAYSDIHLVRTCRLIRPVIDHAQPARRGPGDSFLLIHQLLAVYQGGRGS